MQTVVETSSFLAAAKAAGLAESLRNEIVSLVAERPDHGELLVGTGGVRKFRFARSGQGKSGGFRVISFYHSPAMPVFLLTVFAKNDKANLTKAERNGLAVLTGKLVETYARRHEA